MTRERSGLGQRLMQWAPLVSIYESRLWRRSALFARVAGLSFEAELACLADAGRVDEASRVLDLACGSGIYSRPFARRLPAGHVVGLDLSRPMLAEARRRSARDGCSNLDLVRGSALALPFRSGVFDVVHCAGALHLFPDVPRALGEVGRVLREGGRFTAAVFRRGEGADVWAARLRERIFGVHAFTRAELEKGFAEAGLGEPRFPHEHGAWLLVASTKPGRP